MLTWDPYACEPGAKSIASMVTSADAASYANIELVNLAQQECL